MSGTDEASPERLARITGVLFVFMAIGGFTGFGIRASLVVAGDASATAENILASPVLFQLSFVADLVAFLLDVPVAVLLYVLLRPVSNTISLITASFRLVYTAIVASNLPSQLTAGHLVSDGNAVLALHFMDMQARGYLFALIFFGVHLVLLGVLLYRWKAFPKLLGVLIALGGVAYIVDSGTGLLAPALNEAISPFLGPLLATELLLALWFLVRGAQLSPPQPKAEL